MSNSEKQGLLATPKNAPTRIVSLDQFRGYTVVGMLLVNFIGSFAACPRILKHTHDYISYADTIMPHFLFAVGFAFRLTFGRRAQQHGLGIAYIHMVRRMLGLVLISIVIYTAGRPAETWEGLVNLGVGDILPDLLKRTWFQTLMHIAITSLWILPVIRASAGVRISWMVFSAALHVGLSYWFAYEWVNSSPNGIDGGPLGILTWTIPAILGTLACDAVAGAEGRPRLGRMVAWSVLIMAFGWIISCGSRMYDVPPSMVDELAGQKLATHPVFPPMEDIQAHFKKGDLSQLLVEPPFVPPPHNRVAPVGKEELVNKSTRDYWLNPQVKMENHSSRYRKWNYWMMSQRGGTLAYLTFSGGFSLFIYVLFYIACDIFGFSLTFFRVFGVNALAAYILHSMVGSAIKPFIPGDAPGWYVWAGVFLFFWVNYVILRHLEKQKIYLKL